MRVWSHGYTFLGDLGLVVFIFFSFGLCFLLSPDRFRPCQVSLETPPVLTWEERMRGVPGAGCLEGPGQGSWQACESRSPAGRGSLAHVPSILVLLLPLPSCLTSSCSYLFK